MRLYTRTKRRLAANRLAGTMTKTYQRKQPTRTAGQLGNGLSMIDGQLYNTGSTNGHGTVAVVNLGRPAAAIYKPQSNGEIILGGGGGGGCSDGGSGGVGIHALDGAYHTGTLAQSQAPWAALDSDLQDHIADPIHHDRLHDVLNADDHEIVAARYTVLGTPSAANTLAAWMTASNGTAGNALLRSDSNGAIFLNSLYAYQRVQSQSYAPGFGGSGYRLDYGVTNAGKAFLEVDDLSVRRRMTVRELLIRKIRTTNGDIFVSSGGEVATATDLGGGSWTLTFKEDHGFLEYDLIAAQAWTGSGVYRLEMTVTDVADTKTLTATLDNGWGDTPGSVLAAGLSLSLARHGNETDADRQGLIYLSSDDAGAPFIRVLDGIDSWAKWGDPSTIKMQAGRLDGITHAVMGDLSGYGLFATGNAYMEGLVVAGNGDTVMGDDGLNIQAGTSDDDGWSNHSDKLTFAEDPMATLDDANVIGQLGANRFVSGSDVVRRVAMRVNAGADSDTDQARIGLEAYWIDAEADVPIQSAAIQMIGEEGAPSISLRVQGSTANAGTITLDTPVLNVAGHIRMTGGGDIGTALDPVGTLYADELVILGEVNYDNPGMVNDTRYYPRTELNTYLDNTFEQLGHSHPGLVTSAALTDTLADFATIAYVDAEIAGIPAPDLSNYWTKAQADGRYAALTTYNAHVGATNPHGTTLASLAAKDYSDLDNRGHVLADSDGLGEDHSVSGLTAGHVLRATSGTAARFMQLGATDLGVTAARYSVIGTPNAADTIAVWPTSSDGTAGNVLLRSGDNGELSLGALTLSGDVTLPYWEIDSATGVMQTTGDYAFASPSGTSSYQGIRFTPSDGSVEATYMSSTEFGAETLVFEQTAVNAGDLVIAKSGGKLRTAATFQMKYYVVDDNGDQIVDDLGNPIVAHDTTVTATIQLDHPPEGEIGLLRVGDQIVIAGKPQYQMWTYGTGLPFPPTRFYPAVAISGGLPVQLRCVVLSVDADDPNEYVVQVASDLPYETLTFPVGSAVADYGQNGDAYIALRTRRKNAYMDMGTLPGTGWEYDTVPFIRLGDIGGLPNVASPGEVGLVGGDIANGVDAYFKLSDNGIVLHNGDHVITDSAGVRRVLMSTTGLNIKIYDDNQESPYDDITDLLSNDEIFRSAITWSDDVDSPNKTYAALYAYTDIYGLGSKLHVVGLEAVRTSDSTRASSYIKAGNASVSVADHGGTTGYASMSATTAISLYSNYININGNAQVAFSGSTVVMANLPTSSTGLVRGTLWNDSGTLKVAT